MSEHQRLPPLPWDTHAELKDSFQAFRARLGFAPHSMMILQRRPASVKALPPGNAGDERRWQPH